MHPLLRILEILALHWKDVDSDGQQIQVTKGEDHRLEVTAGVAQRFRMQRILFETASEVYDQMAPKWKGSREYLLAHLVRLVEQYINSGRVIVDPPLFNEDDKRRRIVITLNMTKVAQHLWEAIRFENALTLEPVFDTERPMRSTGDMLLPWYSGKACEHTKRSHINMCVHNSRWEANESIELDRNQNVRAWVKSDHIGFEITYSFKGSKGSFTNSGQTIFRLANGRTLILEVKGRMTSRTRPNVSFYPNGSERSMGTADSVNGRQMSLATLKTCWRSWKGTISRLQSPLLRSDALICCSGPGTGANQLYGTRSFH